MKALTLLHPWAAMVRIGAKHFETRPFPTAHRGRLAIHVSRKWTPELERKSLEMPYRRDLAAALGIDYPNQLRAWRGHVIYIVQLVQCWLITPDGLMNHADPTKTRIDLLEPELSYGEYTPGHYAWQLAYVEPITPMRAMGQQNIWNWDERPMQKRPR